MGGRFPLEDDLTRDPRHATGCPHAGLLGACPVRRTQFGARSLSACFSRASGGASRILRAWCLHSAGFSRADAELAKPRGHVQLSRGFRCGFGLRLRPGLRLRRFALSLLTLPAHELAAERALGCVQCLPCS